jgi:hypothetical protein
MTQNISIHLLKLMFAESTNAIQLISHNYLIQYQEMKVYLIILNNFQSPR